jgi:phosphotransferase system enzyme I (PtsI)
MLHLVARIVEAAERHRIPVSVCGELAADPRAIPLLVGLGIRELSASPIFLPEIKRVVRSMEREDAVHLAQRFLQVFDVADRLDLLLNWLKDRQIDYFQFVRDDANTTS